MPAALPGTSDSEQVKVGQQVEEILQHPGFQALVHALHIQKESILRQRVYRQPSDNPAAYADVTGQIRGIDEVVPLARGLVQNGNEVAERRRREGVA